MERTLATLKRGACTGIINEGLIKRKHTLLKRPDRSLPANPPFPDQTKYNATTTADKELGFLWRTRQHLRWKGEPEAIFVMLRRNYNAFAIVGVILRSIQHYAVQLDGYCSIIKIHAKWCLTEADVEQDKIMERT